MLFSKEMLWAPERGAGCSLFRIVLRGLICSQTFVTRLLTPRLTNLHGDRTLTRVEGVKLICSLLEVSTAEKVNHVVVNTDRVSETQIHIQFDFAQRVVAVSTYPVRGE